MQIFLVLLNNLFIFAIENNTGVSYKGLLLRTDTELFTETNIFPLNNAVMGAKPIRGT